MTLAIAVIAIVIAFSQAWLLRTQTRESRVALCTEVVDLWRKSSDSRCIMIAVAMGGTRNLYAPSLTATEEGAFEELKDRIDTFYANLKEPSRPGEDLAERLKRLVKAFPPEGFTPE